MGLESTGVLLRRIALARAPMYIPLLDLQELVLVHSIAEGLRLGLAAQAPAVCFICWNRELWLCKYLFSAHRYDAISQ